jgi:hypothetical protein
MSYSISRPNGGFSLIEALLMLSALLIFSMILYAVIKKDYFPPQVPTATAPVQATAPKAQP